MLLQFKDYTPDWKKIIFYMDGELSSGDYVEYFNGALDIVATLRPEIPPEAVHKVEAFSFKARDGLEIPTLLTIPNGKKIENMPAIVMPHGGPASYDSKGFDYMTQYFASEGYLVIQPQFRGSTGFGREFRQAGYGEWGRKMQNDVTDAVMWLAKKGKIDSKRVCIVGASYGGYSALAGAVFTPDLYQCVVSINGVSNLDSMVSSEQTNYGDNHWVVSYWQEIISKGEFNEDHLNAISPINHVEKIKAPVLLIHGEYDEVVPINQSEDIADELEDADKKVVFITLRKGDHYLSKAENRMKALQAIGSFVKQYL